jgi:hypothetical protein
MTYIQKQNTITPEKASDGGYKAIAGSFGVTQEDMFNRFINDFRGCDIVLVELTDGIEIWRHGTEMKEGDK